jgi:hypothetical protein
MVKSKFDSLFLIYYAATTSPTPAAVNARPQKQLSQQQSQTSSTSPFNFPQLTGASSSSRSSSSSPAQTIEGR